MVRAWPTLTGSGLAYYQLFKKVLVFSAGWGNRFLLCRWRYVFRGKKPDGAGGLFRALRPRQWTKNVAVVAPLLFAQKIFVLEDAIRAFMAVLAFCLLSSAVYIFNDLADRKRDQQHPVKRLRPIASGAIGPVFAGVVGIVLGVSALSIFFWINSATFLLALGYVGLQTAYTGFLKRLVIIDVFAIAFGFVVRVATGAYAIEVPISNWLYLCTLFLALFLGFSKRRAEFVLLDSNAQAHRSNLADTSIRLLDQLIATITACTVLSYALYTMSDETVRKFGSDRLKYTIPCVIYGVFRYLYLIYQKNEGGTPEKILLTDIPLVISILVFGAISAVAIYC